MKLVKALAHAIGLTLKRLYDIFATYLLFWVAYLAVVAVGLHFGFEWLWVHLAVANPDLVWAEMAASIPLDEAGTRLLVTLLLHALIFTVLRRPIAVVQPAVERTFDSAGRFFARLTHERWSLRLFGESLFTVVLSALLVPFVLQPTLVRGWDAESWALRASNLVDGKAVLDLPDSVIGYYGRFTAEPIVVDQPAVAAVDLREAFAEAAQTQELEVRAEADQAPLEAPLEESLTGVPRQLQELRIQVAPPRQPVMDRWDDHILDAVGHDEELFAYVKAFMYVESAGRQYAVSRTGCAGLMQFCAGTARSQPYREVFGTGKVYACGCRGASCAVSSDVQLALESGDVETVEAQEPDFPCELTDARFDPEKALGAGALYVQRLHRAYGGNIYLMYIGYNSGPGVANKVFEALGNDPGATIEEIDGHLTKALRPHYGADSSRRARSLVRVHLPKIERAHLRYGGQAPGGVETASMPLPTTCEFTMALPSNATLLL